MAEFAQRGVCRTPVRSPATEREHAQLLSDLEIECGRSAVFAAGLSTAYSSGSELVDWLASSGSPRELTRRFGHIEAMFHLGHRTAISLRNGSIRVTHDSALGKPPTPADSLFVCGAMVGMFHRLPVRLTNATIADDIGRELSVWPEFSVRDDTALRQPFDWTLHWCDESQNSDPSNVNVHDALRRAVAMAPSENWTLASAAGCVGMSARTLQRSLQRLGTTTQTVIVEGRLDAATSMLSRTDAPATDVATLCGFTDLPHLSRHVRAEYGVSPGEYRRRG